MDGELGGWVSLSQRSAGLGAAPGSASELGEARRAGDVSAGRQVGVLKNKQARSGGESSPEGSC